jgi:hypothetical protein
MRVRGPKSEQFRCCEPSDANGPSRSFLWIFRFHTLKIARVETFSESPVNWSQQFAGSRLIHHEPRFATSHFSKLAVEKGAAASAM